MVYLKTEDEIELLRQANLLVGKTLAEIARMIKPGVTTRQIDQLADTFIRDNGALPTFKGVPSPYGEPFPASVCTSVNDQVVHGIGREMHEDPMVPNYGRRGNGMKIQNGLCIAIEPMITMGSHEIGVLEDGWTVVTRDGQPAAHFEHTIAIHNGQPDIMSSFEEVELVEGKLY